MNNKEILSFIVFFISIFFSSILYAEALKKAQIKWNPIIGADKYKVEIIDKDKKVVFTTIVNETQVNFKLPYGDYKYRIAIINKFNKIYKWSKWYEIALIRPLFPVITSISPKYIYEGDKKRKIVLKGRNFYKKAKVVLFKDNAEIPMSNIEYHDKNKVTFEVSSDDISVGEYNVKIINSGYLISKSEIKFQVKKREKIVGLFHHFGIEGAYFTPNLSVSSGYNGFGGIALFYEFHNIGKRFKALSALNKAPGLYIGTKFYFFSFAPSQSSANSGLGSSYMIQFLFFFGYDFFFPIKNFFPCHVSPFIGYKQYMRWHSFEGQQFFGSRPVLPIGVDVSFDLPMNFFIGTIVEYNVIFDNTPVNVFGFSLRFGYKM